MRRSRRRSTASRTGALVEQTLVVPAVVEELNAFHHAMDDFWRAVDQTPGLQPEPATRMAFTLGVAEIATNVLRYSYAPPRTTGDIEVRLRLYADHLEAVLTDRGGPFLEPGLSGNSLCPTEVPEHGLGLGLARRTLDRVVYSRTRLGVNRWQLIKNF